ncbi:GNAT family N-acetyltransferase, partial [Candidatus Bathyarchaeota archaeon]|nr:GNAT family N-acetyltransferase [Candidatus Bathyarchaeota archaeon]
MLKIRRYQPVDRKQCRDLWKELTVWHRKIYQDPTIGGENPEHCFDEHLAKVGPERLWVAAYDTQVVGLVGLVVEEVEAEIEPLIVSENYRCKGIGMQLLRIAISEARKLGVKFLKV